MPELEVIQRLLLESKITINDARRLVMECGPEEREWIIGMLDRAVDSARAAYIDEVQRIVQAPRLGSTSGVGWPD